MKHHVENDFLKLIEAHKAIIYKIANLYAQITEDREDLFQEIVINLWKAYPSFKGKSKISTWMYQIGLNTAITSYRQQKKKVKYEPIYHLSVDGLGGSVHDEQVDRMNLLYQAIDRLNKIDKAIILLYLEEKSYKEISQIMGITAANAGMKIKRIKDKLARYFIRIKY